MLLTQLKRKYTIVFYWSGCILLLKYLLEIYYPHVSTKELNITIYYFTWIPLSFGHSDSCSIAVQPTVKESTDFQE